MAAVSLKRCAVSHLTHAALRAAMPSRWPCACSVCGGSRAGALRERHRHRGWRREDTAAEDPSARIGIAWTPCSEVINILPIRLGERDAYDSGKSRRARCRLGCSNAGGVRTEIYLSREKEP